MADAGDVVPKFDPELLQARWVLGSLSAEELTKQALSALEQGFTGIALQQIAGLTRPNLSDLGTLPERAFTGFGLQPVTREQAVAFLIARQDSLTNGTIISILAAFPAFSKRWRSHVEFWGGIPAGSYNDMAAFVHFVVEDLYSDGNLDGVRSVFRFMERLLEGSSQETKDLIGWGFFETLQNVASSQPGGYKGFERFLGSTSDQIWRQIQRNWAGKSSLADVIRSERDGG